MNQYLKIIKQRKIRHIWFVGKWWRHKKTNNNLYFLFHVPNKYITYVIRYPSNVLISRFPRDISHILSTQMAWFFKLASFSRTQNGWVFSINIPSQNEKPFVSATKIFHLRSDYDVSNRNIKYINQLIKLRRDYSFQKIFHISFWLKYCVNMVFQCIATCILLAKNYLCLQ